MHVKRMRSLLGLPAVLVVVASVVSGAGQPALPEDVRTAADRISAEQLAWDLAYLASDDLRGRNTPSPGFDAAADYITARLARAGLKPAGDDGGFRQHYDLYETRVDAEAAYLEVAGRRFAFGRDFALRSFADPLSGPLPVVYVGHGWTMPDHGIDPYEDLDVRGKLVLAHGPRALPRGVEITQVGRAVLNAHTPFVEAERRGAAGILFVTQATELLRWDALRGANTVRRELEPRVPSAYAALGVTSVLIAPHVTEALFAGERVSGHEALRLGDLADYPASFQLEKSVVLHVPVASRTLHRPYNVVAMIEGRDPTLKREHITVEAHLDGAVGSRTVNGDAIYNSADDNASGSAAMLSIAEEMMRAPRPARSVIFIWDSGEEQGLWGTRWFVHAPPVPLSQIVAHVNIDMIGASRRPGSADEHSAGVTERGEVFVIGPGVLSARVDALLERVNDQYLKLRFNREHDRGDSEFFYPRTDAGPFLERGILTIGFTTGIHDRYHLPSDQARHLDPAQLHDIARTVFASLWMLADADERPGIDRSVPPTVPTFRPGRPAPPAAEAPRDVSAPGTVMFGLHDLFRLTRANRQDLDPSLRRLLETLDGSAVPTAEDAEAAARGATLTARGLLAEEGARVVGLLRLGVEVDGFARRGDLVWVVQIEHLTRGVTQQMWVSSTTGAVRTMLPSEEVPGSR